MAEINLSIYATNPFCLRCIGTLEWTPLKLERCMTKLTEDEARSATNNRMPRHVLFVGTALAIVSLTLAFWYFAA